MTGARATQRRAELEIDLGDGEQVGGRVPGVRDHLGGPCRPPPPMWTKSRNGEKGTKGSGFILDRLSRIDSTFFRPQNLLAWRYWGKTETETTISGFRSLIEKETRKWRTKNSKPLKKRRMRRYSPGWFCTSLIQVKAALFLRAHIRPGPMPAQAQ